MADMDLDGVDAELVFPNGAGFAAFWTSDPELMGAQFRLYNDWTEEATRAHRSRMNMVSGIATGNVDLAVAEVRRVAAKGYRVIALPTRPVFGRGDARFNYNLPEFDPLWAAIEETGMTITFHVSTGADPRGAQCRWRR